MEGVRALELILLDWKNNILFALISCLQFFFLHADLAAWFRLKYPHIAIGAVASSAPILLFKGLISPYKITDIITYDYRVWILITGLRVEPRYHYDTHFSHILLYVYLNYQSRSEPCYWTIKSWWGAIDQLARTDVNKLADSLKICEYDHLRLLICRAN